MSGDTRLDSEKLFISMLILSVCIAGGGVTLVALVSTIPHQCASNSS
jgi:hypothetical protein